MPELMDFLLPMLIFLLIGIIGITFWIAWVIFKARYKKQLKPDKAAESNVPAFSVAPREVYLLAVDRASDGAWEITVNGEYYPNLEAVPDEAVRQNVVAGLKEVVAFARGYVQKEQAARKPPAPPQPAPGPAVRAAVTPTLLASAPTMPESRISPTEKPVTPPAPPVAPPPTDRLRVFLKDEPTLRRSDAAPAFMPALDLAREIGDIVAEMQVRIPSLAHRSIKLQNAPSGGVHFAIDGIVYPNVNEIPDADIQALIRAATKEWERR